MEKLTEEKTAALKAQFGNIYEIEVPLNDEGTEFTYAYLKRPTRQILGAVMTKIDSDPMSAYEIILKNCIIKEVSDNSILDNDELFMSCISSLGGLISVRKSELKKI